MADKFEFKVPAFPQALADNTRRAARSIKATIQTALDSLRELKPEVEARFASTDALEEQIKESQTQEARTYRAKSEECAKLIKAAEEEYQAKIKEFKETRDARKRELNDTLKSYFAAAVQAEPTDEEFIAPPSDEDWKEIIEEVQALNSTLRNAQANAKRQLGVEFELSLPVLKNTGSTGERDTGQYGDWRPRFDSVERNGQPQTVKDDEGNDVAPILSQIVAKLPDVTRDLFLGSLLQVVTRDEWEAAEPGEEYSFTVTSTPPADSKKSPTVYSFQVTKAEPIVRAAKQD